MGRSDSRASGEIRHRPAPLKTTYDGLRIQFAQRLDQACDGKTLNKTERSIVAELIIQIVGELLADRDDPS